ncbi:MAG: biotin-dependent carboxyltransferase family protein [Candidatus Sedimenticola sp. 6PFRAG7]
MGLKVISPGVMSMVVDFGRAGYQHLGVSVGGPMDEFAYLWSNKLLGNHYAASVIEVTYGLFECQIQQPTIVAIAGADLEADINGQPVKPWQTYSVDAGDLIAFHMPKKGLRAYLAVKGGFKVAKILGSSTTVARDGLGGVDRDGAQLKQGDILELFPSTGPCLEYVPDNFIPDYDEPLELGVILGYQKDHFLKMEVNRFFSSDYEITQNIDRMGYRLSGTAIHCDLDGIISEGISYGAVQIPKDGQPIVLLRDRQTIGGYPKIGCVTSIDAAKLSQRAPRSVVRFKPVDILEAESERMLYNKMFGF